MRKKPRLFARAPGGGKMSKNKRAVAFFAVAVLPRERTAPYASRHPRERLSFFYRRYHCYYVTYVSVRRYYYCNNCVRLGTLYTGNAIVLLRRVTRKNRVRTTTGTPNRS